LPLEDVRGGGDDFWQLVGLSQFLVLEEVRDELGAPIPLVELGIGQLGRAERGADELEDAALVLGGEEKLSVGVIDNLKLSLVLQDVLKYELFL